MMIFTEGMVGILLSTAYEVSTEFSLTKYITFFAMFMALLLRLKHEDHMNLPLFFFIIQYVTQNFTVNLIDLLVFKTGLKSGYYHDFDFLKSFSYKLFQIFLCAVFSFIYG